MGGKRLGSLSELAGAVERDVRGAAKAALTRTAFTARKNAVANVERSFTLRNRFTVNSIRAEPCGGGARLGDLRSSVGILARAGYMARQEAGGTRRTATGANLAIPTAAARGGRNENAVRGAMRLEKVLPRVVRSGRRGSRKANLVARAFVAARSGGRSPFVRIGGGIFRVSGWRRLRRGGVRFRSRLVYNFKFRETETPARPWLLPASEYAARLTGRFFAEEMGRSGRR